MRKESLRGRHHRKKGNFMKTKPLRGPSCCETRTSMKAGESRRVKNLYNKTRRRRDIYGEAIEPQTGNGQNVSLYFWHDKSFMRSCPPPKKEFGFLITLVDLSPSRLVLTYIASTVGVEW